MLGVKMELTRLTCLPIIQMVMDSHTYIDFVKYMDINQEMLQG